MVTFIVPKLELLQNLKTFKVLKTKKAKALKLNCEITVTEGRVTVVLPGVEFYMLCKTNGGAAKISIPYFYFLDIVKNLKEKEAEFKVNQGEITLGILTFNAQTWFFSDDTILRSIQLPVNYTDADILRLRNGKYTQEELDFNKMDSKINQAEENLKSNIFNAYRRLRVYGVSHEELEKLVHGKLK